MQIKTANELTAELLSVYAQLRDGQIDHDTAAGLCAIAATVVNTHKAQLVNAALVGERPCIPFFKGSTNGVSALPRRTIRALR